MLIDFKNIIDIRAKMNQSNSGLLEFQYFYID